MRIDAISFTDIVLMSRNVHVFFSFFGGGGLREELVEARESAFICARSLR